ncbi:MAG: DUF1800 domain-containing protein [Pyrinomonadaceae bacterium]
MTNSLSTPCKGLVRFLLVFLIGSTLGIFSVVEAAQSTPVLISTNTSTRAIVLESVTMKPEPFQLTASANFSADTRTRITLFCMNLDFLAGESASAFTADAEDAAHNHYPLLVEYVGQVPPDVGYPNGEIITDFRGIYMVVLRLNDAMTSSLGDVLVRLNLHGVSSNRVRVGIGSVGGGPSDDAGAVPTPAPQTPPAMVTPPTIAQYQGQFNGPVTVPGYDEIRFLEQATWGPQGPPNNDLQHLRALGLQGWLNEQFNTPPLFVNGAASPPLSSNYPAMPLYPVNQPTPPVCDATCVRDNYTLYQLQKQFVTNALTRDDQLRQRVSFALHKLIVVAGRDLNANEASWYAPYLQAIDKNAFGNFRQLLKDVTLNPGMGRYLDMAGNSKVAPNENYSREIMQLFSIGTDMLNQDGTPILDANGNRIPSYGQTEITDLARVFTGWTIANTNNTFNGSPAPDYISPMTFNNNANANGPFDTNAKTLLNGQVLPACTNTAFNPCTGNLTNTRNYKNAELDLAMDNLFNHQNTGPYLCTQLIHQLVTSNPTPPYVGRCAAAFANNGSGVRGDMRAVITAILLDPEARGDVKSAPTYGRLREPVQLMTNLLRNFNATSDGVLTTNVSGAGSFTTPLGQDIFNPPTVFSYFPQDYGLPGTNLFGPEFGILDTSTTFSRANFVNTLFLANSGNGVPVNNPNRPLGTQLNYSSYQAMAASCTAQSCQLVDALNAAMMHGAMSAAMMSNIVNAVTTVSSADPAGRTRTAIYLIATSSQYQVER